MVHCYSTDETINQFTIGYMINSSLNCNKVSRVQVDFFKVFHLMPRKWILFLRKNNTCVMALLMIYENNGENH